MKKVLFLVNPNAGKGGYKAGLGEALRTLYSGDLLPTVYFTSCPGDAVDIVAEHAADYDLVVCMGGDGTLSETTAGLMSVSAPPPLGYIPMGTANDVAATLGLSRDPAAAAQTIVRGRSIDLDIGVFGENGYFTYVAAFGAFTEVSYETPQETKHALGHLAYILEGMARLPRLTHYRTRVEYDGNVIEDDLVFGGVTNSTSVAGLVKLNSNAVELGDGLFEVILVRKPANLAQMNDIVAALANMQNSNQSVTILHCSSVRFSFDAPVAWTRDGESGGMFSDISFSNRRGALRILVD